MIHFWSSFQTDAGVVPALLFHHTLTHWLQSRFELFHIIIYLCDFTICFSWGNNFTPAQAWAGFWPTVFRLKVSSLNCFQTYLHLLTKNFKCLKYAKQHRSNGPLCFEPVSADCVRTIGFVCVCCFFFFKAITGVKIRTIPSKSVILVHITK